ncbi:MAG: hypothetical protein Edafosvirus56_1 [Edafosvirus sp.]|uniref:C2H2-type domain-containing protein n=1 Tax=Edafosvirus sp. TaxID=2487765 RepID=A0A3G4ZVM5_9VIRU|nr:MAG: hypothetical protein Edafosvirus56_1 [Edafosvirus sp.]
MKHECYNCGYKTTHKGAFDRHMESKKHLLKTGVLHKTKDEIEELEKIHNYVCPNCGQTYADSTGLYKHQQKKVCVVNNKNLEINIPENLLEQIDKRDEKIYKQNELIKTLYEDKVASLRKDNEKKDNLLVEKDKHIEYMQTQIIESNKAYQQTFDFIVKHIMPYKIGLEEEIDYSVLHDEGNDMKLLEELIYQFEKNSLADYFVGLLVRFYHKDDPRQQAVHNTDAPRVNYVIVIHDTVYDKNNKEKRKTTWKRDKGGIMFGKAGLDKLFENLNEYLKKKIHKSCVQIEKLASLGKDIASEMARNMLVCNIQKKIQDESFKHEIIKKACPHFAFDKEKYEKQILKIKS